MGDFIWDIKFDEVGEVDALDERDAVEGALEAFPLLSRADIALKATADEAPRETLQ